LKIPGVRLHPASLIFTTKTQKEFLDWIRIEMDDEALGSINSKFKEGHKGSSPAFGGAFVSFFGLQIS